MSEFLNNSEYRKNKLKEILLMIHKGRSVDEIKKLFKETFTTVSSKEITEAEQALIEDGVPVAEIQNLCDIHSSVFRDSITDLTQNPQVIEDPGHPSILMKAENRILEGIINKLHDLIKQDYNIIKVSFDEQLEELINKINLHYAKKETVFFSYLERYGVNGPTQVMWGVDNEIKAALKELRKYFNNINSIDDKFKTEFNNIITRVDEMIFKEEAILLPMVTETIKSYEWYEIAESCLEIGYYIDAPEMEKRKKSQAMLKLEEEEINDQISHGDIKLPSGYFNIEELTSVLNTLPFDITFVDKNNTVRYFSETKERTFPRSHSIIERKVSNCHPPESVHIVEDIIADLKSGKKDHEDFWIQMKGQFILIRYYAIRNPKGEYLGVIEVTQNIKEIQALTGEKRLVELDNN